MKKTLCLTALATLAFGAAPLRAQVVLDTPNGNIAAPAPATPVAPTPGGETRAIRREERRIDRNDATGTLAPTVNPNGKVTANPNAVSPSVATPGLAAPGFATPGVGAQVGNGPTAVAPNAAVGANVNVAPGPGIGVSGNATVAPETWRYRQQNGQWLYYTPQNNWMIYSGNAWAPYTANANMGAPVAPAQTSVVAPAPAVRAYSYPSNSNNGYYNNGSYNNGYNSGYYNDGYHRRGLFGRRRY